MEKEYLFVKTRDFWFQKFAICSLAIFGFTNISFAQTDSIITLDDAMQIVKQFHPVAKQANLQTLIANAELLKAKGSFDPVAQAVLDQKELSDQLYYSILDGAITWATPFGATIKSGYELNRGPFLNPENNTPGSGLLYAGISLPLGQGLLIDERRAARNTAEIGIELAQNKRADILNKIFFEVSLRYWEWFRSFHVRQIFDTALRNAGERYQGVVINARSGDRPFIDTVEAKIQLQLIDASLNQASLEYKRASLLFSSFLWDENNFNTGLDNKQRPSEQDALDDFPNPVLNPATPENFESVQPYLAQLRQKIKQQEIERKLKQDKLKPMINVQYNPITEPVGSGLLAGWSLNNYTWGLEFKMPLLLRKERGDLRLADLRKRETQLELDNSTVSLYNNYRAYISEYLALLQQARIFEEAVENYQRLFDAESRLFQIGESSLFLVNAREQSLINARIKYLDLQVKAQIAYYSILYYSGLLAN